MELKYTYPLGLSYGRGVVEIDSVDATNPNGWEKRNDICTSEADLEEIVCGHGYNVDKIMFAVAGEDEPFEIIDSNIQTIK